MAMQESATPLSGSAPELVGGAPRALGSQPGFHGLWQTLDIGLDVDTIIPTDRGLMRLEEIDAGTVVYGADGNPTRVCWVGPTRVPPTCREFVFSTGESVVAASDHRWRTVTVLDRNPKRAPGRLPTYGGSAEIELVEELLAGTRLGKEQVTIAQLRKDLGWYNSSRGMQVYTWAKKELPVDDHRYDRAALLEVVLKQLLRPARSKPTNLATLPAKGTAEIAATLRYGGKRNHAIAAAPPVLGRYEDLRIDPYVLGMWLGDGSKRGSLITTADAGVIDQVREAGFRIDELPTYGRYAHRVSIGTRTAEGFVARLRAIGVLNNKHIPAPYLSSSMNQRRRLLAGLMDSDGWARPDGGVEFTNTNKRLIDDMRTLACSLGYRASLREGVARLNGRAIGPKWTVAFCTQDPVFLLRRKAEAHLAAARPDSPRSKRRYIDRASTVEGRPVRAIAVEAEDGQFLITSSYIATCGGGPQKVPVS